MERKRLKGQFFILGALALAIAFYIGLNIPEKIHTPHADDLVFMSRNMKKDLPLALNLGLMDDTGVQTLNNFTLFSKSVMRGHYINYSLVWAVVETLPGGQINVTVGNYWGEDLDINMNVNDVNQPVSGILDSSTFTTQFPPVGAPFYNFTLEFGEENRTVEFANEKVNLYSLIELKRGEALIREEIAA